MMRTKLKKWGLAAALFLLMSLMCLSFAACGDKTEKFKVTFYDGDEVITTKSVEKGGKVEAFAPADVNYAKEGFTFADWFATADYTQAWSFDRTIEKDTNVYSQWVSSQADTRPWQIAGSSAAGGPLKTIGWNGGTGGGALTKTKDKNEFTLTIDLYVGDEFQLCVQDAEGAWVNDTDGAAIARGGQYLVKNDYMAPAAGGLGAGQKNIVVAVAGNYTLTLTTDALDKNYGKITVKRNSDAPEVKVERKDFTWYIYGNAGKGQEADSILKDMNWGNGYDKEAGLTSPAPYAMKKTSDNKPDGTGTWLMTAKFDVDDEFLFAYLLPDGKRLAAEEGTLFKYDSIKKFNGTEDAFESKGTGNNIAVKTAGTYTFELTVSLDADSQILKASIEVWDNVDILTSEREWAVFGNRMKYEQVTGTGEGLPGLKLTEEEYAVYDSDIEGNDFGKGENVKKLTKVAAPADGAAIQYEVTLKLGVGDYFYFCIPIWVHEVSRPDAYTTGGYNSTVVPAMVSSELPEGIGAAWTNNFLCTKAGNYKFVVSVASDGTRTVAVTAAA